ncbi:helix-turn-helix transcriptional regulator [Enterococcus sp. 5H]|uniref:helix-turn-helix transcriptional regulator n=1 Tax=Enterococcus sp. 5H TaxID=1229490 RepID=UPI002304728B|nr:helix-turn-helix transcriptional regulator [Enterococcus sp. 5H]MDA9472092.1 putative phage transcriptional regulator [Enterococcus sp. 5H]
MKTLKEIRVENGITQKELAGFFQVSYRTIYNVERDSSNIKDSLLAKYRKAFNLNYDEIFLGSEYEIFVFEEKNKQKLRTKISERLRVKQSA